MATAPYCLRAVASKVWFVSQEVRQKKRLDKDVHIASSKSLMGSLYNQRNQLDFGESEPLDPKSNPLVTTEPLCS